MAGPSAAMAAIAKMHGDFGLGRRLLPTGDGKRGAGGQERIVHQETDERGVDAESLHGRGTAKGEFPAERFVARIEELSTAAELRGHSAGDAWVVPGCFHDWEAIKGQ